ncbi:hypothetical protein FH972_026275 [Carpinus fangiana]|uniref:RING-type E3 ubiquitin transferase n=1 Tax=Carpinus fangiana TaxID=176857 RepID=A0A5N6L3K3_9ROSI|nr:hypothetical protein FH972_026275 [Carpinus fangiana]
MDAVRQSEVSTDHAGRKGKEKEKAHEDICVICLETISERAIAVPCNHCNFDFICLLSWLQDHPQCPLCKAPLTAVEYDWRAPHDYKTFLVPSLCPPANTQNQTSVDTPRLRCRHRGGRGSRGRRPRSEALRPTASEAISRRRYIYRRQLYSLHVGSNAYSRFRDFTPSTFAKSSELQSRARMWIRRELQVFDFLSDSATNLQGSNVISAKKKVENLEFLLSYIVSVLGTVDVKSSSGAAQRLLTDFLGQDNAGLFLHELSHWLRSPYTQLENWDRNVQYAEKLPEYQGEQGAQTYDSRNVPWGGSQSCSPSSSRSWNPH